MKKLIVVLLTVSFLFVGQTKNLTINAEGEYIENLIDLKNIVIRDNPEDTNLKWYITTKEPISLEAGSVYTFILSKDFFSYRVWNGQEFELLEVYFRFYDPIDDKYQGNVYEYTIVDYEYCYITFTAAYSSFSIHEMPVDGSDFSKIMLYKGGIDSYNGSFTSFKSDIVPIKGVYVKDYDVDLTLEQILSSISITDDFTDNVTYTILEDNYTLNKDKIGEYNVRLTATDDSYNRAFYNLIISIIDVTDPVITGTDYYLVELNQDNISLNDIRYNISFYDNVSNLNNEDLFLISDEYSGNKMHTGTYNLVFKVVDDAGNFSLFEVLVEVVDTTPPTITGPVIMYRYTTDALINEAYIKNMFTAFDLVDGDLTNDLIITGSYNNVPGEYEIIISVKDNAGNTATKTLIINIIDGSMPNFISDDLVLTWNFYSKMDHEQLKTWLNENIAEGSSFNVLFDETIYNKDSKKETYIYYSYELNGQTHYGRLIVMPKENMMPKIIISSVLGLVNLVFIFFYFKRPKIHL